VNTTAFEAQLKTQGYQDITLVSRDATYQLGEHSHPFDACALIMAGSIRLQVHGVDRVYHTGEVFELARDTVHHEWAGSNGVSYIAGRRT
jgi:quercetin dioxygenase-like cupin family protein